MPTIRLVIDDELLNAADRVAHQNKIDRSALVREALREYLKRLQYRELERRDREGYEHESDTVGDLAVWEGVAAWPEEFSLGCEG